jgi:xanthine dehydrogenase accessory factor
MDIWKFVHTKLEQNIKLVLLVVVQSKGSSPGKIGFKMVVTQNKELLGSLGGGDVEHEMVELAYSMLKANNSGHCYKKIIFNPADVNYNSGMICSGSQDIVFIPLSINQSKTIEQILLGQEIGAGLIKITNYNFSFCNNEIIDNQFFTRFLSETDWEYVEKIGVVNKICIIGAGHVGLALSKVMRDLDFEVEIYDDRQGLNTYESNKYANKKFNIDYDKIDEIIEEGDNVYIVIMTFGHQSDELVLKKLMNKHFKYLGMMGSKAKVKKIFENIKYNPNLDKAQKIYAPIGISIKSQTPAEIAISIAAEIIQIKNESL